MVTLSTLGVYQTTVQGAALVQSNIATIQQQVSSGVVSQNFEGLNGSVELYVSLQNQMSQANQYSTSNSLLQTNLNTSSQALGQVIDVANQAQNLILQATNSSESGSLAFTQQLQGYFQTIAGELNTQANGQYLFSGSRTDTAPVDPNTFPTNVTLGVPDDSYYQGSKQDITATIAASTTVTANVRADDPGFQDIMSAFATAQAGFSKGDTSMLQKAYTLMQQGVSRITEVQTSVGATSAQVQQADTISSAQVSYWKSLKDNTVNADLVSLSTQLATDQSVLQATFEAFAKINSLQLSNYLTTTG